jgi:hypothetical protein
VITPDVDLSIICEDDNYRVIPVEDDSALRHAAAQGLSGSTPGRLDNKDPAAESEAST